ncbi:hypothetical protein BHE74_00051296 [Ensete ventricosum]|nr:hypothetical protein GW17_00030717 [Ensete ventricosum]RWW43080.1 hypothetical protein BHE74_00051296 [Ensete ventricosum]RZR92443.1 hypothetical protein BHM03_00020741 [Ensete ventricosum]
MFCTNFLHPLYRNGGDMALALAPFEAFFKWFGVLILYWFYHKKLPLFIVMFAAPWFVSEKGWPKRWGGGSRLMDLRLGDDDGGNVLKQLWELLGWVEAIAMVAGVQSREEDVGDGSNIDGGSTGYRCPRSQSHE